MHQDRLPGTLEESLPNREERALPHATRACETSKLIAALPICKDLVNGNAAERGGGVVSLLLPSLLALSARFANAVWFV